MNLYAYCLSDEELTATGGQEGVGGASVRVVSLESFHVLVSDFSGERVALARENIYAHNRVVGAVLRRTTPLPFRFGTLASETRLREYVEANRASLLAALARVGGCVEMSVKIMWDAEEARRAEGGEVAAQDEEEYENAQAEGRGAAYLRAKQREMAGTDALKARAEEIAAWLAVRVGDAVRETRARVEPEAAVVVRAAHLVERTRLDTYRERVRAAIAERGSSLRFLTSGAWPPYSFCDLGEVSRAV